MNWIYNLIIVDLDKGIKNHPYAPKFGGIRMILSSL